MSGAEQEPVSFLVQAVGPDGEVVEWKSVRIWQRLLRNGLSKRNGTTFVLLSAQPNHRPPRHL